MSLEHKLMRVNTLKRVQELENKGELEAEFASEIKEAFNFLLTLKLKSNLQKLDSAQKVDNYIDPEN